jgi:ParB-like chromosome segregation protein Spo0J
VRFVGDTAIIVDGNCRFAACQIAIAEGAEILTLPCVLEPPSTTAAERLANQFVANSGLAHSPIEWTAGVKMLVSFGWTETAIANRFGKSRQWVSNILDLAGAGSDVHELISNGTVSATQAIKLIRSEGANAGEVIAKVAQQARIEGRSRVTAKAFRKIETPNPMGNESVRPVPTVGLLGAAREILRIWDSGSLDQDFTEAMECLRAIVAPVREMAA